MADLTKGAVFREAREKIKPVINETEGKKNKLFENVAAIISLAVIVLSIVLYAYNTGYCRVFNLPPEVMSLDMKRLLPLAVQLFSTTTFLLSYISSLKADHALKKNCFNLTRILWGACIVLHFLSANNFTVWIGNWWSFFLALLIPVLVEVMLYWARKPKKDRKVDEVAHQIVLEEAVYDSIFYTYYFKYGIFLVVLPMVFAPMLGEFSAKAQREYQTCVVQEVTYAVIVDYEDKALVQHAVVQENALQIDTGSYFYLEKTGLELRYSEFDTVSIGEKQREVTASTLVFPTAENEGLTNMPTITDWLMVIITLVYVIATIMICSANRKSAEATREQLQEAQKQYKETNRPYVTCEYILTGRVFCGIRLCNHGNQVARNLRIEINKEFLENLPQNRFANFRGINDSIYSVIGIGQSFDFHFGSVSEKPTRVPLVCTVTYEHDTDEYMERFVIDLGKQLPIESVESDVEGIRKLLEEQNQILRDITRFSEKDEDQNA